jgi:hypothetical protein
MKDIIDVKRNARGIDDFFNATAYDSESSEISSSPVDNTFQLVSQTAKPSKPSGVTSVTNQTGSNWTGNEVPVKPIEYVDPDTSVETPALGSNGAVDVETPSLGEKPPSGDLPDPVGTDGKPLMGFDPLIESNPALPAPGGGGTGEVGFNSGETVVTGDGGFVQMPSGIEISGYIYPYLFFALTLIGGGIGFFVAHKYKQATMAKLALIAAGLMAGSAIGMKVKPPVKKIA